MTCFQDIVKSFELSPIQVASYLWRDVVYSVWDGDCENLSDLTPDQLRALGHLLLTEADIKEEVADVA